MESAKPTPNFEVTVIVVFLGILILKNVACRPNNQTQKSKPEVF